MRYLRIHNRRSRTWMVFITLAALLFIQNFPLHTHGPHAHHAQGQHEHYSEIHVASSAESDEAHGMTTKIDLSAAAVVKSLKFGDVPFAVLAFIAVLLLPRLISAPRWSVVLDSPFTTRGIAFRPPLRAPPR